MGMTIMVGMKSSLLVLVALALWAPGDADGRDGPRAPNWDTTLAMQTADVPAVRSNLEDLFALLRNRDLATLQARLDAIISGGSLSQPVRESILFNFAVGLADFEAVDEAILQRLRAVEPRVFVPHEERSSVGVPLFNIAGAAEGVYQLGLRREAWAQALQIMEGPPDGWLDAFLTASRAQRAGFAEALGEARAEALSGILAASLQRLASNPELTPIAGKSALLLGDEAALERVLRHGGGSELARILEAAGVTLAADDALSLLQFAVAEAPTANAALAIAQLYPALADRPEATALLLDSLANEDLGAAAALALAGADSAEAQAGLERVARHGDGPAAARARSALDVVGQRGGGPR